MVNVGPLEMLLVAIIALIVLGPARLPEVARSVGRGMREFRSALSGAAGHDDDDDELEPPDEEDEDDEVPPGGDGGDEPAGAGPSTETVEPAPVVPPAVEPPPVEPPPLPRTPPGAS